MLSHGSYEYLEEALRDSVLERGVSATPQGKYRRWSSEVDKIRMMLAGTNGPRHWRPHRD